LLVTCPSTFFLNLPACPVTCPEMKTKRMIDEKFCKKKQSGRRNHAIVCNDKLCYKFTFILNASPHSFHDEGWEFRSTRASEWQPSHIRVPTTHSGCFLHPFKYGFNCKICRPVHAYGRADTPSPTPRQSHRTTYRCFHERSREIHRIYDIDRVPPYTEHSRHCTGSFGSSPLQNFRVWLSYMNTTSSERPPRSRGQDTTRSILLTNLDA
jgi:hypothetical protein